MPQRPRTALLTLCTLLLCPLGLTAQETDPVLGKIDRAIENATVDRGASGWKTRVPAPPDVDFPKDGQYYWKLETNVGTMVFELLPEVAPEHVTSTIWLTRLGFYDGLSFHRIIPNFMAQGGCPLGSGTGGPGYQMEGEFSDEVKHSEAGLLSMANSGPGTDGSQFFITFAPTSHLDGKHTIFGKIVSGSEVLPALAARGSRGGSVAKPVTIRDASILTEAETASVAKPVAGDPLEAIAEFIAARKEAGDIDLAKEDWRVSLPEPPLLDFSDERTWVWELETSAGPLRFRLLPETAPKHVSALIYLTELGFYEGLSFHRIIGGFMAQGGCPLGNGRGRPGFQMALEVDPEVKHDARGVLASANSGPGTDGCQFYVTFKATPHLDGSYSIFGRLEKGQKTLRNLEAVGTRSGRPKETVTIGEARILTR